MEQQMTAYEREMEARDNRITALEESVAFLVRKVADLAADMRFMSRGQDYFKIGPK